MRCPLQRIGSKTFRNASTVRTMSGELAEMDLDWDITYPLLNGGVWQ